MEIISRMLMKLRKVGDSHIVTVPHLLVKEWGLKDKDLVAVYQIDGALVIYPLRDIPTKGRPKAIERAQNLIRSVDL